MENRYIQLMILMAAGEIDSCKYNANKLFNRLDKGKDDELKSIKSNVSK